MRKNHTLLWIFAILWIGLAFNVPTRINNAYAETTIEGKAECVVELETGRILHEKSANLTLPMASTTKILTAITVLENCKNLNEEIMIPQSAVGVEGSSVYLQCGEKYTVLDLLYGLMLRSGNDCATALALYFGGNISSFCVKMNLLAQKAGALNSHFENPHGLPAKNHYTTALDLCYITRYAMKNEVFAKIVSTKLYEPRNWKNKNKLLISYDGAIGVKTGYTREAGRCLVSAAKRDGRVVICTVLNCAPMYERSAELLDKAFALSNK